MPLDPSIILGGQAPQFQNLIDQAQKVATMQNLVLQNNVLQKQNSDSATMSDILKRNTTVDSSTGAVSLNRQSALQDLYKFNPQKAMDFQKQLQTQDLDAMKNKLDAAKSVAYSISSDPKYLTTPAGQSDWVQMKQNAIKMGLQNANQIPDQPDSLFLKNWQGHTINAEEQIKNAQADRTSDQKDRELDTKEDENQIKREQLHSDNYQKYVQHVEDNLKSFRGDPATTAASMRISAAAGGKGIIDKYRDNMDQMPIQDVAALAAEKIKSITGATPGEQEVEAQLPHTLSTKWAALKSGVTGSPEPANAGDFVRNMDEGFKDQEKTARSFLVKRQADIAGDPRLKPQDKDRLSQSIIPPKVYDDSHPQDDAMVSWAKANPKAPGAAQVLKANGM